MKLKSALFISILIAFSISPFALADDTPTHTMATIIAGLNHFPSAEQKVTLTTISEDEGSSQATKTLATTLAGMQHKVSDQDKVKLQEIVDSEESTDAEKTIAKVLMGINHKPSAEAVAQLSAI